MKIAQIVVGGLFGLAFIIFGLNFFVPLSFLPKPTPPPEGSHAAMFMGALYPSGYLAFVKVLEILGGVLTAIPKTRVFGMFLLVPILVNIMCFHLFFKTGRLFDPMHIGLVVLAAAILIMDCGKFRRLLD